MSRPASTLFTVLSVFLLAGHAAAPAHDDFAGFVEPNFPFITTTVDAGHLAPDLPARNVAVRGVVVQLGNEAYAAFDPDLLRMAVAWHGDFMELTSMAHVSYDEANNKRNGIPKVIGQPVFGTGIYPGWTSPGAAFEDPRPAGPNPDEVGRGPLPAEMGRWSGLYVVGDQVVFAYTVAGTTIYEQPGSVMAGGEVGIVRTFAASPNTDSLTLVAAEVGNGAAVEVRGNTAVVYHGPGQETATAFGVVQPPPGSEIDVVDGRYVTLTLPPTASRSRFSVIAWKGRADRLDVLDAMLARPVEMADVSEGGPARWPRLVSTQGKVDENNAPFVLDALTLPLPNPWRRNVRPSGIDFFADGRAAVSTFDGDVWLLSGIDDGLENLTWKRFASGLFEPLTLKIVDDVIHVFGREGIVRLHDLNGDGEADHYENFSNLPIQTVESREYPLSMGVGPDGSFYISKGAALDNGPKTAPQILPGFRSGGPHSGAILRVAPDGDDVALFAAGLREPFVAVHPQTGLVTTSDQQGNFVPSTPVYVARQGDYFGVPATAHGFDVSYAKPPLLWIPHQVDQSGAGQVWAASDRMGPLNGALVHLSYGEPAAFLVYIDSTATPWQGAIVEIPATFRTPAMQGAVGPQDGQLYVAGFHVWGSKAQETGGIVRLRYTGLANPLPAEVLAGAQGVILRFDEPLDPTAAAQPEHYTVERWNYRRTEKYGSGHFKLDGSPGQEVLPVSAARLSDDRKAVLLVLGGMDEVMQMAVRYDIRTESGLPINDAVYLTVNRLNPLDLERHGFDPVDTEVVSAPLATNGHVEAVVASPERGRQLFEGMGCVACHSTDGTLYGKAGPTFKNAFGTPRTLTDGSTLRADESYLRRSIFDPGSQIVEGYHEEMPSYVGILSDTDVESIILFIKALSDPQGSQ